MRNRMIFRFGSGVAILALLLAACGDGGEDSDPAATDDQEASEDEEPSEDEEASEDEEESDDDIDLEEHFSSPMEITVGFNPGGGYDLNARSTAQFLPNHLPGDPRIQVSNITGADGINSLRHMMQQPADGRTIAVFEGNALSVREFLGDDLADFSIIDDVEILGTSLDFLRDTHMYCVRSDVGTTWDEMIATAEERGRPIKIASQVNRPEIQFINSLDLPIEVVTGYEGGGATLQAVDSGEVDGTFWCHPGSVQNTVPHWFEDETAVPIIAFNDNQNDDFFEEVGWERPPLFRDLVDLTDEQSELLDAIGQEFYGLLTYTYGIRADTPPAIRDELVESLEAMANDPEFIEHFEETANRFVRWRGPEEWQEEWEIFTSYPDSVHESLAEFVVVN